MKAIRKIGAALVLLALLMPASADAHGRWGYYGAWWAWWAAPPLFYYSYAHPYPYYPYYPYPYTSPNTVVIERNAPTTQSIQPQQFWYYCESAKSYYPYVPSCREEWRMVPVTPPAPGLPAK